jgi:hypothetical protein
MAKGEKTKTIEDTVWHLGGKKTYTFKGINQNWEF